MSSSDTAESAPRLRYTFSVYSANSILTEETVPRRWDEPKSFPAATTVDSLLEVTNSILTCTTSSQQPDSPTTTTTTNTTTDSMKSLDSDLPYPEQEVEVEYHDPRLFASYLLLRQKRDPPPSVIHLNRGRHVPSTAAEI